MSTPANLLDVPDLPDELARPALRRRLIAERLRQADSEQRSEAGRLLGEHLERVLAALEPDWLGVYWAVRGEFNAASACLRHKALQSPSLALPFARRSAPDLRSNGVPAMHYRAWNGDPPVFQDECGIPSSSGAEVVPDVVLVPCVGYTSSGYRLGYGGGYFDRWLALNPHVTAVGIAWSESEIDDAVFAAQPYDLPLSLIVTEQGVVS